MIKKPTNPVLTYVSLFSSAGVGCYGFLREGFECVATNELLERRLDVQKANDKCRFLSGYVGGDITESGTKERIYKEVARWEKLGNDRIDVVIATPPCQGISVINHKKNANEIHRNSLVVESVEVIRRIQPRFFVFENVQAFQKALCVAGDGEVLPIGDFIHKSLGADYLISGRVLNFMNYGANSSRTRTLVIGVSKEYRNLFAPYDLFPLYQKEKTLREVIGTMRPLEWGEIDEADFYHAFRTYEERMRAWIHDLKEGQSAFDNASPELRPHRIVDGVIKENTQKSRDKYTRQRWDRFIQCVHTRNDQLAAQNTIHPEQDRVFSIRELMEMMTIPRSFRWMPMGLAELNALPEEEKWKVYRKNETNIRQCLGEAVPTQVICHIATGIRQFLLSASASPSQLSKHIEAYGLWDAEALFDFVRSNPLRLGVGALMRIAELCNAKREKNEAFYTNKFIVNEIMNVLPDFGNGSIRILEPSVGVGNFLPFLFSRYSSATHVTLDVMDIDAMSIRLLREILKSVDIPPNFTINVINDDFLLHRFNGRYNLVVGNPPFSKLCGDLADYEEVLCKNINRDTRDLAELFLEKATSLASTVALVLNKTILATDEYAATRDFLRRNRIAAILDFGRYGFSGVSIETMCLVVEPKKQPQMMLVRNLKHNIHRWVDQLYVTDPKFPYFIIYRDETFDTVAEKMDFGVFSVVRDRQITKRLLSQIKEKGSIRVLKARNITDEGQILDILGYDAYMREEVAQTLSVYKYVGDTSVYLTPNMTYNPRVILNDGGWLVDGSVAILVPKEPIALTDAQLRLYLSPSVY